MLFFSVISRRSQRNGDYLRAEFHDKASLWISVAALILGGFCWAVIVSVILLKLKVTNSMYDIIFINESII